MTELLTELRDRGVWLPDWLASLVILVVVIVLALVIHRVVFRILTRIVAPMDLFWRSLVSRLDRLMRLAILAAAVALSTVLR